MREHHKTADAMERIVAAPRAKVYAPCATSPQRALIRSGTFIKHQSLNWLGKAKVAIAIHK
ncbi:hypothetical protein D0B88_05300 [Cellvibrio sp. KY-YJ-3]|nr:hypothetical protein D0B88_05300 [Cellvibrio sp. KY-YJ-3]